MSEKIISCAFVYTAVAFESEQEIKVARLAFRSVQQADGEFAAALNIALMKTSGGASKSQSPSDVSKSHHIQLMEVVIVMKHYCFC